MRTAKRTLAGFSSRIGSHGGTHGNESVIDTCHAHKYDGATMSGAAPVAYRDTCLVRLRD